MVLGLVMFGLTAATLGLNSNEVVAQGVGRYVADRGPGYDPFDNNPYLDGYNRPVPRFNKGYQRRNRWCHFHEDKVRGMKQHAKPRCHKHGRPYHPSIKYVY